MKYARTERFKKAYAKLPSEIQTKVITAFQLFKENPRHPSLGIKRVHLSQHWPALDCRT